MSTLDRRLMTLLTLVVISGCSAMKGTPFDPSLVGRDYFLCCNIAFSTEFAASDANYGRYRSSEGYGVGPRLASGTRVHVTKVGSSAITFQPADSQTTYMLIFRYGQKQLSPGQYFHNILRDTNPMETLANAPRSIADAIHESKLVQGMTKEQALIARGYPPAHRTPSLDGNEWMYFDTPGFVDRVVFADGTIQSITRGPAPE